MIFAPNRSGGGAQESTELHRLGNLNYKEDHTTSQGQHERTLSYDSVRKSWVPVLTHNMEQRGEVNADGIEALVSNRSDTIYTEVSITIRSSNTLVPQTDVLLLFQECNDGKIESFQIPTPLAVAIQLPSSDKERQRWQGQPAVSPYGYPLADR